MGAETPNVRPGQEGPEGKLDPPVLGEWAQSVPSWGTLSLGPRSSFWAAGGGGTQLLLFFPEGQQASP